MDSTSAIAMGNSFKDVKHTRHIRRHYYFVRHGIATGKFMFEWIETEFMLADLGMKQTPGPCHMFLTMLILILLAIDDGLSQEG